MDLTQAIKYGQLVSAAYDADAVYVKDPTDTTYAAGHQVSGGGVAHTIVTTIYANDLATEINPLRSSQIVPIGFVLQATGASDVVIAIRGTEGVMEWIQDAKFGMVPCAFVAGAGNIEDGFDDMYASLRTGNAAATSPTLIKALAGLPFPQPVNSSTSITICGHSLGAALATLLVLDVAVNTIFKNPTVYTYASPRTGDSTFATLYNHLVPNTYRIANRVDIVPKLPMPPLYDHVLGLNEVNPVQLLPWPPKILVRPEIACEHIISTYLYLLSVAAGGPVLPLTGACVPMT